MNKEYYIEQIKIFNNYHSDLLEQIRELKFKIEGDYYKGKPPHEYQKALDSLNKLHLKLEDLEFNISWFTSKVV
jgi:hypothetical protein